MRTVTCSVLSVLLQAFIYARTHTNTTLHSSFLQREWTSDSRIGMLAIRVRQQNVTSAETITPICISTRYSRSDDVQR